MLTNTQKQSNRTEKKKAFAKKWGFSSWANFETLVIKGKVEIKNGIVKKIGDKKDGV